MKFLRQRRAPGFTLIELLVVISVIALLIGILLPSLGKARKRARQLICEGHIRQLGIAQGAYESEHKGRLASYTWEPKKKYSQWNDLNNAPDWVAAAANQLTDILRRRADREDLKSPTDRLVHRHYSHVILNDYMSQKLPELSMACPEDKILLGWQKSPVDLDPKPKNWVSPFGKLWAYSSSYQIVPVAWAPDRDANGKTTFSQYPLDHNLFWSGTAPIGRRAAYEVSFPGSKVHYFDYFSRHTFRQDMYYGYSEAVVPLLFFDGSVRTLRSADCNPGWDASSPEAKTPSVFSYNPSILGFEPPTLSGQTSDLVIGYYRWTREGLRGVDIGKTEVWKNKK